jgi:hypothetical protein
MASAVLSAAIPEGFFRKSFTAKHEVILQATVRITCYDTESSGTLRSCTSVFSAQWYIMHQMYPLIQVMLNPERKTHNHVHYLLKIDNKK